MQRQSGMRFAFLSVGFSCAALLAGACSSDSGLDADCNLALNPCVVENQKQCAVPATGVETCLRNTDGCLVWALTETCTASQTCGSSAQGFSCQCASVCTAGQTRCKPGEPAVIQTCTADAQACTYWLDGTNCAASSQTCVMTGTTAGCATQCNNLCTAGQSRCLPGSTTVIQNCSADANGCTDWVNGTDCAATSEVCIEKASAASCEPTGGSCDKKAEQIFGAAKETLFVQELESSFSQLDTFAADDFTFATTTEIDMIYIPGTVRHRIDDSVSSLFYARHLHWAFYADNGGQPAGVPEDGVTTPQEIIILEPDDPQVFIRDDIETGMYGSVTLWLDEPITLPAGTWWLTFWPHMDYGNDGREYSIGLADTSNGAIAKLILPGADTGWEDINALETTATDIAFTMFAGSACCADACSMGTSQCDDAMIQTCANSGSGCTVWQDGTNCATNNQECSQTGTTAACADCTNECDTPADQRCNNSAIETCTVGADGCNDWIMTTDCWAQDKSCDEAAGPACVEWGSFAPGNTCDDANMIPISVADLPVQSLGQTTCGSGDNYNDEDNLCAAAASRGQDIFYALTLEKDTMMSFKIDPKGSYPVGFVIGSDCPPSNGNCEYGGWAGPDPSTTACGPLSAGTHYIMIDILVDAVSGGPDCIPEFDLWVEECGCASDATRCFDANTLEVCNDSGSWEKTQCDNGCAETSTTGLFACND